MASESPNFREKLVFVKVGKGDKQKSFTWLSSVFCFHSPFFVGALERSFKEAKEHVIILEEDDPVVFREFMRWVTDHRCKSFSLLFLHINHKLIHVSLVGGFGSKSENTHLGVQGFYHLLVRIYIFADKYMMPRLQNVVIDTIISTFTAENHFFTPASVNLHYNRARDGTPLSALRKLMIDMFVLSCPDIEHSLRSYSIENNPFCAGFVQDAFYKYLRLTKDDARVVKDVEWWSQADRCYYHVAEPQPQDGSKTTKS